METSDIFNSLLQKNQADLFEIFARSPFSFFDIVKHYMKSKICRYIDGDYSRYQNAAPKLIYSYLLREYKMIEKKSIDGNVNKEAARWLGYFYRRWNTLTGEHSSKIVSELPPKEGIESYFTLHQMNEEQAISVCKRKYNLRRNSHRIYETKETALNINEIDEELYLSFAKSIFVKLYGTSEYKSLQVNYSRDSRYDLISEHKKIGIISKILNKYSFNEIKNLFIKENEELMFSRFTAEISNLFIMIVQNEDKTFENELNKLIEFYLSTRNKFDNVFVFNNNTLYQINKMYELTKFNLGTTLSKVRSQNKNLLITRK